VLLQEVSTIDFANYWNLMLQFFRLSRKLAINLQLKFLAENSFAAVFRLSRKAAINFDKPAINVKKIGLGVYSRPTSLRYRSTITTSLICAILSAVQQCWITC